MSNQIYQNNPGSLIPFLLRESSYEEALSAQNKLSTYYLVKATSRSAMNPTFTGFAMGSCAFVNGIAKVRTLYEARMLYMRGCVDITPPWMLELHKERDLKRILVIRNAAFGDVQMITPVFQELRKKYPDAIIHFYGREDTRDIVRFTKFFNGIIDCRTTELGALLPDYDEMFDLVHSIECSPVADYETARDLCSQFMGLDLTSNANTFTIHTHELQQAEEFLRKAGIRDFSKMVIFQYEGTALARSLTPLTTLIVANMLAEEGYEVLLWSHRLDLLNYRLMKNEENRYAATADKKTNKEECVELKDSTGKTSLYREVPLHPNIKHCHPADRDYNRRILFSSMHFARHVIAVDSFFSHLADALSKSCTIIFTNYHPFTRTKYYDLCDVVTVDYPKDAPCGPCNGLLNDCPLSPGQIPLCSSKLDPVKIFNAAMKRLVEGNSLYQDMRDSRPVNEEWAHDQFNKIVKAPKSCNCKLCGSSDVRLATVKNTVQIYECVNCASLFSEGNIPCEGFDESGALVLGHHKALNNKTYRSNRDISAKDIMQAIRLNHQDLFGKVKIIDMVRNSDIERTGGPSEITRAGINTRLEKNLSSLKDEQVIYLSIDGWLELNIKDGNELVEYFESLIGDVDSRIVLQFTPSDSWDRSNKWKYLTSPVAGIVKIIPSLKALEMLFHADYGVYKDRVKITTIAEIPNGVYSIGIAKS